MHIIQPDNLAEVWPDVRKGLEAIIAKTGEEWLPEDVYHDLKQRKSVLYVRDGAFLVLRADGQALDIWCAYRASGEDFASGFDWLKSHAREHGFKRLTMTSPRKGWGKYFTAVSTNYKVEL